MTVSKIPQDNFFTPWLYASSLSSQLQKLWSNLTSRISDYIHGTWWSKILASPNIQDFKATWRALASDRTKIDKEVDKVCERYKKTLFSKNSILTGEKSQAFDKPMGTVYVIPKEFGLWMPGVAILATYLSEKKQLNGLYVCQTVEAFSRKIRDLALHPEDQRCALIVAASSGKDIPNFPQHKVTVCVEKKAGTLSVALLDCIPILSNQHVDPDNLTDQLWYGIEDEYGFNTQELIYRAILKGCGDVNIPKRFLHSQVEREKCYGCEAFALMDGVAFLNDKYFFSKVVCSPNKVQLNPHHQLEVITQLPPEFMLGVQSSTIIQEYQKTVRPYILQKKLLGKMKAKNFFDYIETHKIQVGPKTQNHYITKKYYKYQRFVIETLETLPFKKVQQIVNQTLLT